jgi:hypothetical protein
MLEREAWRFINNRRKDDAEYLKFLDSVSNQEERELLWKNYLRSPTSRNKSVDGETTPRAGSARNLTFEL